MIADAEHSNQDSSGVPNSSKTGDTAVLYRKICDMLSEYMYGKILCLPTTPTIQDLRTKFGILGYRVNYWQSYEQWHLEEWIWIHRIQVYLPGQDPSMGNACTAVTLDRAIRYMEEWLMEFEQQRKDRKLISNL